MAGRMLDWLGSGNFADRVAIPDIPPGGLAAYLATDTSKLCFYPEGGAWTDIDYVSLATPVTQEQVEDWVAASLNTPGAGITVSYNDGTGKIEIACTITQYADSDAESVFDTKIAAASIGDLGDVDLTGLADKMVLKWDNASTSWKPVLLLNPIESFTVAVGDETTAITTGVAKVTFRMPYPFTLTAVRTNLKTTSSSGLPEVDVKEGGASIFSTRPTIDVGETTSVTAVTPPVISDANLADDAEMTIDIVTAGTGATGLKVTFIGRQP